MIRALETSRFKIRRGHFLKIETALSNRSHRVISGGKNVTTTPSAVFDAQPAI